jgi:hypothetical protein
LEPELVSALAFTLEPELVSALALVNSQSKFHRRRPLEIRLRNQRKLICDDVKREMIIENFAL